MSRYAAANICMAVENFKGRGYAALGGIILDRRNVANEDGSVKELAEDFNTSVTGYIDRSEDIAKCDELGEVVVNAFPESKAAEQFNVLAENILKEMNK